MATPRQKRSHRPSECKATVPSNPLDPPDSEAWGGFERPWMRAFVADALATADVPGALGRAGVGWGDYVRSRREHPAFLVACQEIDLVIRHALWTRLESLAAAGDSKSIKLLNGGLSEIRRTLTDAGVDPVGPRGSVANHVPELHQVGPIAVPSGPCACCARGIMVYQTDFEGRLNHILIRHEVMEGLPGIEPYPDTSPDLPVIYGHVPGDPHGKTLRFWEVGADGQIRPEFVFPALDGPTRAEIWAEYLRRNPERRNPGPNVDFLAKELEFGETPTATVAHRYEPAVDQRGRPIFRLKAGDSGAIDLEGATDGR